MKTATLCLLSVCALAFLPACGEVAPVRGGSAEAAHPLLGDAVEIRFDAAGGEALAAPVAAAFAALGPALESPSELAELVVAQPDEGVTFAPDDDPPRFLWRDASERADTWWIRLRFASAEDEEVQLLVPGTMAVEGAMDLFSASLHAWTPSAPVWSDVAKRAMGSSATLTFVGFAADQPGVPLSRGAVTFALSDAR